APSAGVHSNRVVPVAEADAWMMTGTAAVVRRAGVRIRKSRSGESGSAQPAAASIRASTPARFIACAIDIRVPPALRAEAESGRSAYLYRTRCGRRAGRTPRARAR